MKRYALAALLLLSTPFAGASPASAPPASPAPASSAQVDQLLTVMRARQTVEAIVPQVQASQQQMVQQLIAGQPLSDEQRQKLDRIFEKSGARIRTLLSWENMQPLYRDIYRQTFSAQDMDAMIGFYGSQAGQNLLDKMPQLMQNTMAAMQKLLVPMLQQMQQDIEAETKASATAAGAAAANDQPAPTGGK